MNREIYERMISGKCPFHNKVLRFNYDLPLGRLSEILLKIFEVLRQRDSSDFVWKCEDRQEWDQVLDPEPEKMTYANLTMIVRDPENLYNFGYDNSWIRTGIFNDSIDWYLRLFLDRDEQLGTGEERNGNIELYGDEELIASVKNALEGCVGHLIVESGRKYVEENLIEY